MRNILLIALLLVVVVFGCKDLLTKHNIDLKGVKHGKKLYKGEKNCTSCHGINLNGNGFIPSCYSCHSALWSNDDHTVNLGGANHLLAVSSVSVCTECHGADLKGSSSRPSCYDCHKDVWTGYAFHSINEHGYYHASGLKSPLTSGCTTCHGDTLEGSTTAPSCYKCHGNEWDGHN